MKKITFLLAFLTIGFSTLTAQNLISAGGFEGLPAGNPDGNLTATTTPWQSPSGGVRVINNPDAAYIGDQFLIMDNDFRNLRQSFTATQGVEYTVSLWYLFPMGQGQIDDPDDGVFISIRENTGGNGTQFDPIISVYIDPSVVDNTIYREVTLDFTAPTSNLLFFVSKQARNADGDGGLNNTVRIDEVSITAKPLSVQDLSQFGFTVYPNPVKDFVNLNAQAPIEKVEIFNLLGQQVLTSDINKTSSQINVSNLTDGVYLMKTYIDGVTGTYKFVKE
jgi:hypothetical protein